MLFKPVLTDSAVEALVAAEAQEDQYLDFKGDFWTTGVEGRAEAAKDVAAFANHLGGTILVGVSASRADERASGYNPNFHFRGRRETLLDWLRGSLVPAGVVGFVDVVELQVQVAYGVQDVLAVNVAPFPFGPVAVRTGPTDSEKYQFFVRRGRETRTIPWEEIMRTHDAGNRLAYLKLAALAGPGTPVRIGSELVALTSQGDTRVRLPGNQAHGRIEQFSDGDLLLELTCSGEAAAAAARMEALSAAVRPEYSPNGRTFGQRMHLAERVTLQAADQAAEAARAKEAPVARKLPLPLDLVGSVWKVRETLHILLKARLAFDGQVWFVEAWR